MQARDLMEFLNGDWADVALEVQREDDWVRLKASDMPNSEVQRRRGSMASDGIL